MMIRAAVLLAALTAATAVDRSKFRTCNDASFCRRHRSKTSEPEFRVGPSTVKVDSVNGLVSATLTSDAAGSPPFNLAVHFYESGVARVRITEKDDNPPRWESPDVILESGTKPTPVSLLPAADEAVVRITGGKSTSLGTGATFAVYTVKATGKQAVVAIQHAPLRIDVYVDGVNLEGTPLAPTATATGNVLPVVSINSRSLSYFEHRRVKGGDAGSNLIADTAAAAQAGGATHAGRKILDWGEDGKPIYEDETATGTGTEHEHSAAASGEHGEPALAKGADGTAAGRELLAAASDGSNPATGEPGLWEESFGSHHDSKPFGPTSVGVDVSFPLATHVYGVPEHASTHALRATDGSEGPAEYASPYRLYNLDVFEYELDNPMALYGSIPVMMAHGPYGPTTNGNGGMTVGVYWNNPTETYVDVTKGTTLNNAASGVTGLLSAAVSAITGSGSASANAPTKVGVATRWVSESGIFDLSILPGPSPASAVAQYTSLTGTTQLPPAFSLGYHQCRWNYKDEADVYGVDAKFEEHAFPYDVLWLDIEHTDGKRYFTWDSHLFPSPAAMQAKLASRGHRMVTIIDPHIKRDAGYRVHSEATAQSLYIKNSGGSDYDGWCWPGSSSYLDFTSPKVRDWWSDQFLLDKYTGSSLSLYTWNDMNEPSVFNGPEVSMNKDAKSLAGVEHREWHNLYGFYQQMATYQGHVKRSAAAGAVDPAALNAVAISGPNKSTRPFVLSRAFFAGSQRYGAIWTGDNAAKWEHLAAAAPMLLTIGVSGLTFAGADVGGFFNNPSTELMIRWYQAGAFQPFFRAHAHIDTARREPWLFGDEVLSTLRSIVRTRYTYLPLWYTLFASAHGNGSPAMRPLWFEFPGEYPLYAIDDQWMVGCSLLVKPIVAQGATSTEVYFPAGTGTGTGTIWYDAETYAKVVTATTAGTRKTIDAPLGKIPVFQKGGSIVPRQMRPRRSSALMVHDPYTLVVTVDTDKRATGTLYLDDGLSFDYETRNAYRLRQFDYAPSPAASGSEHVLRSTQIGGGKAFAPGNTVERIIIAGIGKAPVSVSAIDGDGAAKRALTFTYDATTDVLVIRKPDVKVAYDWSIALAF